MKIKKVSGPLDGEAISHILEKDKKHIDLLLTSFPDLMTYRISTGLLLFTARSANWITDEVEFINTTELGVYVNIHYASPYLEIKCDCCDNMLKVYSQQFNIPMFMHYDNGGEDNNIMSFAFDDVMKSYEISSIAIGKVNIYMIEYLKNLPSPRFGSKIKADMTFVSQNIKKLLTFS